MHLDALSRYPGTDQTGRAETDNADTPMVAAKVRIPATTSTTLIRERLHALVDAAAEDSDAVTIVRAPAGAGKTMLLATWARHRIDRGDAYVAWASVDSEDNDPALLWLVILRALKSSGAWPADCPLDRLTPPRGEPYSAFLNAVIAAFEPLGKPIILIVDGVHDVQAADALHTLNLLLRHLPPRLRVVLATRFPPPLILPRLKLEGRLREIGPDELAFSVDEARLLYANEGIRMTEMGLGVVMERTEGWAAALRLAAIFVADAVRPMEHITAFSGEDRMVADYLRAEILSRQPEDIQRFMLSTCVCRTFTADLAAVLCGQENAGQVLDRLEHTGVLVRDQDGWYRYHPLLRSYLRLELGRRGLSIQQRQHGAAAGWFIAHRDPLRAMEHAIAAGDDDLATRLVAKAGLEQILKGHSGRLRLVIETIPSHVLSRPSVALVAAAAALDVGDVWAADRWLRVIPSTHSLRTQRLQALCATVQVQLSRLRGDVGPALAALDQTSAGHTGDVDVDLLALFNRGVAAAWTGRHQAAKTDLQEALRIALTEQRDVIAVQCDVHLAALAVAKGDPAETSGYVAAAFDLVEARGWGEHPRTAYLYSLLGIQAYQRADTDRAGQLATLAIDRMAGTVDPTIELCVLTLRAVTEFDSAEDPHKVAATLREDWQRLEGRTVSPALIAYAAPAQQRMALRVGEVTWALEVLDRVESLVVPCGERVLLRAILSAHKGRVGSTRRLLEPVLNGQIRTLVGTTLVEAWLLEAHLADRCAEDHRAHEALSRALGLAAPQEAIQPFREAGHSVRDLLARGAGRFGRLEPFATRVRAALPVSAPTLSDGLTERERELLAELPSMRTAEEIAQTMFLSINTIKTHLRGIYRKLGVSQRRDAISVARERGLL
jgi:LuxR family maltose regulon positive regulatory protein